MRAYAALLALGIGTVALSGCASTASPASLPNVPLSSAGRHPGSSFSNLYVANSSSVSVYAPGSSTPLRTISQVVPVSLAVDATGNLYVANNVGSYGNVEGYAPGTTTPDWTITQKISQPRVLATDASGNVFVGNAYFSVNVFPPNAASPVRTLKAFFPISMAFDAAGRLYVGTSSGPYGQQHARVEVFPPGATKQARELTKGITDPRALAFDARGDLYVANGSTNAVVEYTTRGVKRATIVRGIRNPDALALDAAGNVYVANNQVSTVTVYAPSRHFALIRTIHAGIQRPTALAIDSSGNLYVANTHSVTVYARGKISPELKITNGVQAPVALAFGP